MIPYLLVAVYGVKLAMSGETYEKDSGARTKELVVASIASLYSLLMIYSGGLKYVLLSAAIYLPASYLYFQARREQNQPVFQGTEKILFGVIAVAGIVAIWAIASGRIEV